MKLLLLLIASAMSAGAQITPTGLYSLQYLGWDGTGTNYQVMVRTQTNAVPVLAFETAINKVAISNLQYGVTYYLSVKSQSNGVWSVESTNYVWPHPQTNYVSRLTQTAPSINGNWQDVPGSLVTEINPPYFGKYWRIKIWESNNLASYIIPQ